MKTDDSDPQQTFSKIAEASSTLIDQIKKFAEAVNTIFLKQESTAFSEIVEELIKALQAFVEADKTNKSPPRQQFEKSITLVARYCPNAPVSALGARAPPLHHN